MGVRELPHQCADGEALLLDGWGSRCEPDVTSDHFEVHAMTDSHHREHEADRSHRQHRVPRVERQDQVPGPERAPRPVRSGLRRTVIHPRDRRSENSLPRGRPCLSWDLQPQKKDWGSVTLLLR